ncbi:MAG: DUF4115 domain-containing protein [Betaproteobacteria bacterium]|nr:DUF4115 domain-containing protein [Betaproteobacteria bacterium]
MTQAILDPQNPEKSGPEPGSGDARLPGEELRDARLRMKMSPADVGRQLKLHPRQVEALEHDDYSIFPSPVFVRGFMRNYARLLGLDGDALIAAAETAGRLATPERNGITHGGENAVAPPMPGLHEPLERDRGKKGWIPITVALIVIAAAIVYLRYQPARTPPPLPSPHVDVTPPMPAGGMPPQQPAQVVVPAQPGVPPAASPEQSAPPSPATTAAAPSPATDVPVSQAPVAAPEPAATTPQAAPAQTESATTPPAGEEPRAEPQPVHKVVTGPGGYAGGPEIHMTFSLESWVDVRNADGQVIFQDLNAPGSDITVRGKPPLKVTVGNSSGVSLSFNGRPVDLSGHARGDIARVTLE